MEQIKFCVTVKDEVPTREKKYLIKIKTTSLPDSSYIEFRVKASVPAPSCLHHYLESKHLEIIRKFEAIRAEEFTKLERDNYALIRKELAEDVGTVEKEVIANYLNDLKKEPEKREFNNNIPCIHIWHLLWDNIDERCNEENIWLLMSLEDIVTDLESSLQYILDEIFRGDFIYDDDMDYAMRILKLDVFHGRINVSHHEENNIISVRFSVYVRRDIVCIESVRIIQNCSALIAFILYIFENECKDGLIKKSDCRELINTYKRYRSQILGQEVL